MHHLTAAYIRNGRSISPNGAPPFYACDYEFSLKDRYPLRSDCRDCTRVLITRRDRGLLCPQNRRTVSLSRESLGRTGGFSLKSYREGSTNREKTPPRWKRHGFNYVDLIARLFPSGTTLSLQLRLQDRGHGESLFWRAKETLVDWTYFSKSERETAGIGRLLFAWYEWYLFSGRFVAYHSLIDKHDFTDTLPDGRRGGKSNPDTRRFLLAEGLTRHVAWWNRVFNGAESEI